MRDRIGRRDGAGQDSDKTICTDAEADHADTPVAREGGRSGEGAPVERQANRSAATREPVGIIVTAAACWDGSPDRGSIMSERR